MYPEETASPLSPYSQIIQQEFQHEDHRTLYHGLTTTTTTLPVDINPSRTSHDAYAYGQRMGSCDNSELSLTPPHEYHSSGSDGGSDDIHSHLVPVRKPLQQQLQYQQYQQSTQMDNNMRRGEASPTFSMNATTSVNGSGMGTGNVIAGTHAQPNPVPPRTERVERNERTEKPSYYRSPIMKQASKAQGHLVGVTAGEADHNSHKRQHLPAMPTTISVQKRKKACSSCRRRKIPCGTPMPGSNKCNQCSRNGVECDIGI